jgi:hypothetical protein
MLHAGDRVILDGRERTVRSIHKWADGSRHAGCYAVGIVGEEGATRTMHGRDDVTVVDA